MASTRKPLWEPMKSSNSQKTHFEHTSLEQAESLPSQCDDHTQMKNPNAPNALAQVSSSKVLVRQTFSSGASTSSSPMMPTTCSPPANGAAAPLSPMSMPTSQESLHLASLVPLHAAHSTAASVPHIVATVFNMCRNRWVSDFLFSRDMNSLSALTAPVNLGHSISCSVTMTCVERDIGLPKCVAVAPNPFDTHVHGDFIFVPAFSVGSISVGFGVQNCTFACNSDWGMHPYEKVKSSITHFRYVRDDEKGILVTIREDHCSNLYKVDYMEHQTVTKRSRSFLTIERAAIHSCLKQDPAGGIDPMKLIPGVRLIQFAEEYRDCPFCGVPKGSVCNCKLEILRPRHPLDFDNMLVNMSSHLGSFEGVATARFCAGGMEMMAARLGSRITIDCRVDSDLLDKLSKWAITDQLKKVKEDPVRSIMPVADTEMTDPSLIGTGTNSGFASGEATEVECGGDTGEHEMETILGMHALVDEIMQPSKEAPFGKVTPIEVDNLLSLNKDGLAVIPGEQLFERISPESTEDDDELGLTTDIAREAQQAYQAENGVRDRTVPSGSSTSDGQTASGYDEQGDMALSQEERRRKEKEHKAEMRKQRNREAAQRSNAKRKEKNDTLKADLRDVHEKAAELRAKELGLREENIRLRKMLS